VNISAPLAAEKSVWFFLNLYDNNAPVTSVNCTVVLATTISSSVSTNQTIADNVYVANSTITSHLSVIGNFTVRGEVCEEKKIFFFLLFFV
jgi:hypothetical protein